MFKSVIYVVMVVLFVSGTVCAGTYSGGNGSAENPYQIASFNDFKQLTVSPADWNKYFIMTNDIDLSTITFNSSPISPDLDISHWDFQGTKFSGVFDGDNHIFSNLTISSQAQDFIGLFGYVNGHIKNLVLHNVNITGNTHVGGLVGVNTGIITSCNVSGSVSGINSVGGLIGRIGGFYFGGHGSVIASYMTGSISGVGSIGGLIGVVSGSNSTVSSCYATSLVSGTYNIGGLIGTSNGSVTLCYATGTVTGTASEVGGLVGNSSGIITSCHATGLVSGNDYVGGLVGGNYGTISFCFATGSVSNTGTDSFLVGGLVGLNGDGTGSVGTITSSYATGKVSGTAYYIGGLVGENFNGNISSSFSKGMVTSTFTPGGFLGYARGGTIMTCFWDKQTSGTSRGVARGSTIGVAGKTTSQMKTLSTFSDSDWDISNIYNVTSIWKMSSNNLYDYPRLSWENLPAYLVINDVPQNTTMGTGETSQFSFSISRKEDGGVSNWTVEADEGCDWINGFTPETGTTESPQDRTTVDVAIDAGTLEQGDYPVRLLVNDGYIYYEVLVKMNLFNRVNMDELAMLASYWMMDGCDEHQPCSEADWYTDGVVDVYDLWQLAQSWMGEQILVDRPGIREDFESGTFDDLPWQHGGNKGWVIVSDTVFKGDYAAQSGTITDFQTSTLSLTIDAEEGSRVDAISFARKVSSESNYDFLRFYVDDVEVAKWSGEQDWDVVTYYFETGPHTFKWSYIKDGSGSAGSDCAWIDMITIYDQ